MHTGANGRTLRQLSKHEDPWSGNNTWEVESSEERQKGPSPEEERELDKCSERLMSSTSILTAGIFPSTGSRPNDRPLPEYG